MGILYKINTDSPDEIGLLDVQLGLIEIELIKKLYKHFIAFPKAKLNDPIMWQALNAHAKANNW